MKRRKTLAAGLLLLGLGVLGLVVAYYWIHSAPLYGQVVLGDDADLRLRFIARGWDIYLDRNADNAPERIEKIESKQTIELADPSGETQYRLSVSLMYHPRGVSKSNPQEMWVNVDIRGPVEYSQYGTVTMANKPEQAGTVHFDGPLAIRVLTPEPRLAVGGEPMDLRVEVSTYHPESGGWAAVCSNQVGDRQAYAFSPGVAPEVEIEFPSRVAGQPTLKKRFLLDQFC